MSVSVCIPTYNGEKYIIDQLQSILIQLSENDEILIHDDFSTDNTVNLINNLNDSRIKITQNRSNIGLKKTIENALIQAKGDYIFLCDQDDVWCSDKISISSKYLQMHDLIISDCYVTDKNLNIIYNSYYNNRKTNRSFIGNIIINQYVGCCMAFKRTILKDVLPFPQMIPLHDIWIGNIARVYYNVRFIPEKLVYHRRHEFNQSSTGLASKNSLFKKISIRINLLLPLLLRVLSLNKERRDYYKRLNNR